MDTSAYVRGGSAFAQLLRNADVLGGQLAAFFVWLANTRPERFEELAQAFADFVTEIEFTDADGEVIELDMSEYYSSE